MDLSVIHTRILDKIKMTDTCWLWQGAKDRRGYGCISKKTYGIFFAHRYTYFKLVGETNLELDHLCRNHCCVNPEHLEPVTHAENVRRGKAGQYQRQKWGGPRGCPKGHPLTGKNLYIHYSQRLKRLNRQCRICKVENKRRLRAAGATY